MQHSTDIAERRLCVILSHFEAAAQSVQMAATAGQKPAAPAKPANTLRWNGWGYDDTEFVVNEQGNVRLTGSRYLFSGQVLPHFRGWAETKVGLNINDVSPPQDKMKAPAIVNKNDAFLADIKASCNRFSLNDDDRIFHAHGHSCQEVFDLRYGAFKRVPDVVVWPGSHQHVEAIVAAAAKHNVVIIPYGGGTTVTHSLLPPEKETRMIVSLDMHEMKKLKWVNKQNMLACFEAGIIGRELEEQLQPLGLCFGHEPDSHEFSSLGGWVATRASGMKKNVYGNIEDLIIGVKFVTPTGTFERSCLVPRISVGPELHEIVMGSEGTLGVVTEVTIKVRNLPEKRAYGSVIFPDFESGYKALYEISMARAAPVSIRLMDNMQFQFGQALKPAHHSFKELAIDKAKKLYVTKILGFDPDRMTAATLMFEGSAESVAAQEKKVYAIATKYGGKAAGVENGLRGYFLTFMIAYLRDFGFKYWFMAESFETSVPYDKVLPLCEGVKKRIKESCAAKGIKKEPFVSCRVTQLYDTGACVYFYFGFIFKGLKDPAGTFSEVEHEAREEILKHGGSLSHHHGVGKLRKEFLPGTVGPTGMNMLKGIKQTIDPQNIFANGNLL